MAEIIDCPSCHRKLQASEAPDGQDVQCPGCGTTFHVRTGAASIRVEPLVREVERTRPQRGPGVDDYALDESRGRPEGWTSLPPHGDRPFGLLRPHRGATVLTIGILALAGLILCLPAVVLGPIAWAMGSSDLTLIRAGRMDRTGEGITARGQTCGIIATVLGGIGLVLACLGMLNDNTIFGRPHW
jgi:hypothetical protein